MRQIASATKMNDLEIRRIIYGLLQAGLVEVTRQTGAIVATPSVRVFPSDKKEEQKS